MRADLDVRLQSDGVVGLHEGVEELVDVDGVAALAPQGEVVALEELADGEVGGDLDQLLEVELAQPFGVVADDRAVAVEDAEGLLGVGAGVLLDLLEREHGAGAVLVAGVADERREAADEQYRLVAEVLELAQLAHGDGVAEGEVGRRGVDAEIDAKGTALSQPLAQLALHGALHALVAVDDAPHEEPQLLFYRSHLVSQAIPSRQAVVIPGTPARRRHRGVSAR